MEEKVYFSNEEGLKLCGILTKPNSDSGKCIVLCHGITVDKEEGGIFTDLASELAYAGFNVFRFDFRGHGESEGNSVEMTIRGEKKDLEAAIRFLEERGFEDFGLLAASFGGGAVSLFCSEHPEKVKALCLWNTRLDYDSKINPISERDQREWGKPALENIEKQGYTEIGSRKFKVGKGIFEEFKVLEPWKELELIIGTPMLFIHGTEDKLVPYEGSVKYSRLLGAKLETIKGADHGFHGTKEESEQTNRATVEFFLKNMG